MDDGVRRKRQRWIGLLFLVIILGIVGYGQLVPYFWPILVIRVLLLVILLLVALLILRPIDQKRVQRSHRSFQTHQVEPDQVTKLLEKAGQLRVVDDRQAKIFALSILAPAEVRKRVVDKYQLDERTMRQTVTIEGQIPGRFRQNNGSGVVYLPALIPPKGRLLDDWHIEDGGGNELTCLTYRESLLVIVAVLRTLLVSACRGQPDLEDGMTVRAREVEGDAVRILIARNTGSSELLAPGHIQRVVEAIQGLPGLNSAQNAELARSVAHNRTMAATLVRKLSRNYVIVAPIRPDNDDRFLFKYRQILVPDLQVRSGRRKWVESLIGSSTVALGTRPVDITIDINNASTCQSYHLLVDGADGLWLGEQEAIDLTNTLETQARGAPTVPHARFRRRLGQAYGHFYVRYFPEPVAPERPRIRFQYFEVPPGSLLRASVTAVASFLLVWVIGAVTTLTPGANPGSDAPAILLAFPAIAATWIGFEKRDKRLLDGTLGVRMCLMITAAVSMAAAALFMAHAVLAPRNFNWWRLPWDMSILWVKDTLWAILVLIALANAIATTYRYIVNTWEYWHLASRPQGNNDTTRRG